MLHIFHGPDSFSRTEALEALKRELDRDRMLASNTDRLDGKTLTYAHLTMICDAMPFLAEHRLIIVEGLLARAGGRAGGARRRGGGPALPAEWGDLPEYLGRMPPTTALVLVDGEVAPGNVMLEALAPLGRSRNFPKLPARALEGWLGERAKRARIELEPAAVRLLAESVSGDLGEDGQWHGLWGLAGDLEKVALYAGRRAVTADDVRALVAGAADTNIFAFVDAVVERKGREAMARLAELLAAGQPPPVLLTMLVRGFRQIALWSDLAAAGVRQDEIARRLNLREWQSGRLRAQAGRYRPAQVAAAYERLLAADRSVKRGESDEQAALELLVAELAAV